MTEIFLKDPSHVALAVELLEEVDFYVRFNTMQLLSTLLENAPDRVKECIFLSPGGIARLMDLLDDRREIIRNEALLVLIALTTGNAEIQKVVAFENAFERLLGLVLEEGASEGGIVVQDCLTLTLNLLRYNVSNQNLFRESGCIQRIPSLLLSHASALDGGEYGGASGAAPVPLTHETSRWPPQKVLNAVAILELVRILVSPSNPSNDRNQTIMNQAHILPSVIDIALSERVPADVRTQALYAVGEIIRGHEKNQQVFSGYVVVPSSSDPSVRYPKPALLIVVELALRSGAEFGVRAGAAYCFQCLLSGNEDNQIAVAATLTPPPVENPNDADIDQPQSPGSLLVTTLLEWEKSRRDPYKAWFATVLLSHVLLENQKAKELAVTVRLTEDDGDVSLLHKLMFVLLMASRESADVRILVGILSLVIVWLHSSVTSVKEFLSEGSNLQFLIEQISQSSGVDPLVQGLSAVLLAICHEFNDDLDPAFTQASLQSLVVSRIGADVFISRVERLKEAKQFQKVSPYLTPVDAQGGDGKALPEVYFDAVFADLLKGTADGIVRAVVKPKAKTAKKVGDVASEATADSYRSLIASQDKEIQRLKRQLAEADAGWKEQVESLRSEVAESAQRQAAAEQAASASERALQELTREQEDLLICLAESDLRAGRLRDRLRALGEAVESDDDDDDVDDGGGGGGQVDAGGAATAALGGDAALSYQLV
ncbi:hypothetical protein HK405_003669 [Cladochytrium tenue]|nr:hypothetical protein HK405_003669 [Cladochytrium tenue]